MFWLEQHHCILSPLLCYGFLRLVRDLSVWLQAKSRFVLVSSPESSKPLGFLNYRWEEDPPLEEREIGCRVRAIVYIYELQLEPHAQGQGVGSHVMGLLSDWVRPPKSVSRQVNHLRETLFLRMCEH